MPMKIEMRVSFEQAATAAHEELDQVVRKSALDVEAHATAAAPIDFGALRASIHTVTSKSNGAAAAASAAQAANPKVTLIPDDGATMPPGTAEVRVGVAYGLPVEGGTVHHASQPYMEPAVNAVRPGFDAAARAVVKKVSG